jgi:hypothetical protein
VATNSHYLLKRGLIINALTRLMNNNAALKPGTPQIHVRRTLLRSIVGKKRAQPTGAHHHPAPTGNPVAPATENVQGLAAALEHEEIAHRAWKIWKAEGCPEGRDHLHWLKAQELLKKERSE